MSRKTLYLCLAVLGAVVPMIAFIPWLASRGPDVRLMVAELLANRISTFFALNLLLTASAVAVFARMESERVPWARISITLMLLMGGLSRAAPDALSSRKSAGRRSSRS